jgi:hypothetical protein
MMKTGRNQKKPKETKRNQKYILYAALVID